MGQGAVVMVVAGTFDQVMCSLGSQSRYFEYISDYMRLLGFSSTSCRGGEFRGHICGNCCRWSFGGVWQRAAKGSFCGAFQGRGRGGFHGRCRASSCEGFCGALWAAIRSAGRSGPYCCREPSRTSRAAICHSKGNSTVRKRTWALMRSERT